jgi:type I restriction enzyme S subunit
MTQWPMRSLEDIATVFGGGTPARASAAFWGGDIPWVTPTDLPMPDDGISAVSTTAECITSFGLANSSATLVPAGTVLFSSRATIGKVAVAGVPVTTIQGFANFAPGPDVLPRYLAYALWHRRNDIARLSGSTTFREVSRGSLRKYCLPVPPIPEQERIVALLDEADALRKLRAQADKRTADLIPALFHDMFGDPEHTRFPVTQLVETVDPGRPVTYGILKPGPNIPSGIPYIRVVDIKFGRLDANRLQKTTDEIARSYRRSCLTPGDILVTIRGTVGRTCIIPTELAGANITQDTARIAPIDNIEAMYLYEFLNTPWAQGWMSQHMLGQAVKGINLGDLRRLPVPIPPLEMQSTFAQKVQHAQQLKNLQHGAIQHTENLLHSVLSHAFTGDL